MTPYDEQRGDGPFRDEQLGDTDRLLDHLDDQDAAFPLTVDLPDPAVPPGLAASARQALALLGGVAGAVAIARLVGERSGRRVRARAIREALRNGDIQALGAGFYALPQAVEPPLLPWLHSRLRRLGPRSVDDLVDDIMARWPHGDARAIRSWLCQDPPGVSLSEGVVRLLDHGDLGSGEEPC